MDLYSQGQSISQANSLTESAREANNAAKEFNDSLAAQLDEANDQLDADAGEQQAINMYQGITSGGKLIGLAAGTEKAKEAASAAKGALKSATTLIPKAVTGAGEEGLEEITDVASFRRAAAGVDLATADEVAGGASRFRIGGTQLGAELAEEGERVPVGLAVPTSETVAAQEAERTGRALDTSVEGAASTERAARSGIQTSSGIVGGEAAVETSSDAVRTGQFAELAGPGAKAAKGLAEGVVEDVGRVGVGAVAKSAVAGVGGGLDIYKDIKSGWKFDNWKQEVGNIGNIAGSALEIAGALTAWTGFGVGAEALGAAISVGSTALETAGDIQATDNKRETVSDDITSQRRQGVAAAAQESVVGRSN